MAGPWCERIWNTYQFCASLTQNSRKAAVAVAPGSTCAPVGQVTRLTYPRINCVVPSCKYGSTRYKPGTELLCGRHWRMVPLSWRRKMALYRRAGTLAARKGNQAKVEAANRCLWRRWDAAVRLLCQPDAVMACGVPAAMAEQLRRDGLL